MMMLSVTAADDDLEKSDIDEETYALPLLLVAVVVVLMDIHPAAEIAAEANDLLWAKTNGGFENESASILTARLMSNCVAHAVK